MNTTKELKRLTSLSESASAETIDFATEYLLSLRWVQMHPGAAPEVERMLQTIKDIMDQNDRARIPELKMLTDTCADIILYLNGGTDFNKNAPLPQ